VFPNGVLVGNVLPFHEIEPVGDVEADDVMDDAVLLEPRLNVRDHESWYRQVRFHAVFVGE
jgi:hypothetical protein